MRARISLGRVAGIPIGLHYSWVVIAVLITLTLVSHFGATQSDWRPALVWTSAILTALLFFATLLLHELSHAIVARQRGLSVRSITLFAFGGVAQIDDETQTASDELLIAIVGPLTSFALGLLCLGGAWAVRTDAAMTAASVVAAILGWLGYINVVLAVFNLVPAYPLDGGRVLRAIFWKASGDRTNATWRAAAAGQIIAFMFMLLGLVQFFGGAGLAGLWLAFIGWFLFDAAQASYLQTATVEELRDVKVADLMTQECPAVAANWSLQRFVDDVLLRSGRRCYMVRRDDRDGEVVGLIAPKEVQETGRETWPSTSVASAARPLASLHTVSPDRSAADALRIMSQHDLHQLSVMSDGHLAGVVTRSHLLQLVETRMRLEYAIPRGARQHDVIYSICSRIAAEPTQAPSTRASSHATHAMRGPSTG